MKKNLFSDALIVIISLLFFSCSSNNHFSFNKRKYLDNFTAKKTIIQEKKSEIHDKNLIASDLTTNYQNLLLLDEIDDTNFEFEKLIPKSSSLKSNSANKNYNLIKTKTNNKIIYNNNINQPENNSVNNIAEISLFLVWLGLFTIWIFGIGLLLLFIGMIMGIRALKKSMNNPESFQNKIFAKKSVKISSMIFALLFTLFGLFGLFLNMGFSLTISSLILSILTIGIGILFFQQYKWANKL